MTQRQTLRILAGAEPRPAHHQWTGHELKDQASANRAAAALRPAANALHRSDSALSAFLRRKKTHLGAPKAITATAHNLARLIYSMLRYGQEYVDAGAEYYEHQYQQWALSAAKRRATQLGYQLVPMPDARTSAALHRSKPEVATAEQLRLVRKPMLTGLSWSRMMWTYTSDISVISYRGDTWYAQDADQSTCPEILKTV